MVIFSQNKIKPLLENATTQVDTYIYNIPTTTIEETKKILSTKPQLLHIRYYLYTFPTNFYLHIIFYKCYICQAKNFISVSMFSVVSVTKRVGRELFAFCIFLFISQSFIVFSMFLILYLIC